MLVDTNVLLDVIQDDATWMDLPKPALFLAAKAFLAYRRRGGLKRNALSDFYIGAHAAVMAWPVLTRDRSKYETYFPVVKLIAP